MSRSAVVGGLALLGAGITGFYMTRLMLMTFYGAKRWQQDVHPHESPPVMTVPLVFLGIGSVFGGLVLNNWIVGWLDPAVGGGGPEETPSLLHFSTVALATSRGRRDWCRDQRVDLRAASRDPGDAAGEPILLHIGWTQ